jgi:heptosyltransferase-3
VRRLVIRPGAIGDTILSLPAMEHLKARYTEIWVRSDVIPLIRFADRVRSIASTGLDLLGIEDVAPPAALIRALGSFDEILSWYGSSRPEFRNALGSFRNVRFLDALPPPEGRMHAADFFLAQVGGQGPAIPRIGLEEVQHHGSIVFHPFSGSARKTWPMERFLELERVLGGVEWAARDNWVRFADLMDLAQWLAGAALYVGNDSGITHLAAAVGAPVLALFGPTDPEIWGPRGSRVTVLRARSIEEIMPQTVLAAIQRQRSAAPR